MPMASPTAARKPNIPIGVMRPRRIVSMLISPMATPTRFTRRPRSVFSRCRSRRAAARTGPSRSSICRVMRSKRAMACSTLSVTSVTSPQSLRLDWGERRDGAFDPPFLHALGPSDIALRLLDLVRERVDGLLHVGQRLELEAVDLVHRLVDVLERALQGLERNGRGGRLLVDRARLRAQHLAGRIDHSGRRGVE